MTTFFNVSLSLIYKPAGYIQIWHFVPRCKIVYPGVKLYSHVGNYVPKCEVMFSCLKMCTQVWNCVLRYDCMIFLYIFYPKMKFLHTRIKLFSGEETSYPESNFCQKPAYDCCMYLVPNYLPGGHDMYLHMWRKLACLKLPEMFFGGGRGRVRSATPCASPPPRPSFFKLFFSCPPPINQDD
jgi:hypothetical protein